MDNNIAIKCTNLCKRYPLYSRDIERLKGLFLPFYKPKEFVALSDINIEFKKGEIVGLIGLNGSGKSTLSSIISGITYCSEGTVEVNGEVNMLSANAGMENQLTGIENIDYKCLLLGFSKSETNKIKDDIISFADIGVHINQPLRTYSSGMRSRLGFAISVHMNPDILIIDEALAVGDNSFTDKCLVKMDEFKKKGKTIIFVSHSVVQMKDFCDKIMWLNKGKIVGIDIPDKIIMPYCGFAREFNSTTSEERNDLNVTLKHYQEKYL
ncbi:ABC transporter ATP-binding protein [Clostridium botulinum]|uniref:ABC transporter ATP-binding protein n=1 Tax=unclassified Clostridium TaxID=2614128 RepID=UPI000500182E|nr:MULTISPECIES: ABC transporter ATP-binding protein [unclassified Clostridium]AIY82094.1 teichoic acids export ATP-binding protein TagH [Clostridium botulinum 202F]KAI3347504.1 ABC transporter ATP-binding protein [Clostridium botulinum]KFX56724.1 teichoic acids export protein ATP-binding subunit [Clostridium botulinum]KFX59698.1 teichoic acids export protein ATP-binding subunit [Clostridium botulinum]KON14264.1 teichoic acids export protein ATP-binding subunit [Clostridium botulinum]